MWTDRVVPLSKRITDAADKNLEKEIAEAAKPLEDLLGDGSGWEITLRYKDQTLGTMPWYMVLEQLKKQAFERNQRDRQQAAIDAFADKVLTMREELEELVGQLPEE